MMHVDDFVADMGFEDKPEHGQVMYARWLLIQWRWPAYMKMHYAPFIADKKLFCTYEGARYRCTGASRLGDVWLTPDFEREVGYEKRVDVALCFHWSDKP
jgi:hypothetical protein